jgi:hypothetical protein
MGVALPNYCAEGSGTHPKDGEGHRLEAPGFALPIGTLARLAQVQEPGRASGEARGRGRLGDALLRAAVRHRAPRGGLTVPVRLPLAIGQDHLHLGYPIAHIWRSYNVQ